MQSESGQRAAFGQDIQSDVREIVGIVGNGSFAHQLFIGHAEHDGSDAVKDRGEHIVAGVGFVASGFLIAAAERTQQLRKDLSDLEQIEFGAVAVVGSGGRQQRSRDRRREDDHAAESESGTEQARVSEFLEGLGLLIQGDLGILELLNGVEHFGNEVLVAGEQTSLDPGVGRNGFAYVKLAEFGPGILGIGQALSYIDEFLVLAFGLCVQSHAVVLAVGVHVYGNERPVLLGVFLAEAGFQRQREPYGNGFGAFADLNGQFDVGADIRFVLDSRDFLDNAVGAVNQSVQRLIQIVGSRLIVVFVIVVIILAAAAVFVRILAAAAVTGESGKRKNAHQEQHQ